jgi:hypothetical protein
VLRKIDDGVGIPFRWPKLVEWELEKIESRVDGVGDRVDEQTLHEIRSLVPSMEN